ncbi:unnamed protein product [Rotaria magnacalcarata]|uniref:Reverse transcriptase domain-containing protein n=2 Tax=Rotaria magnacalcarata TaxID=392030 RepID=A0A814MGJ3_9BILA|nr:unnamed protein product [Rotaria magnacalcarata]CAF4586021.1 unnamed protein product [Rotaria magnacalcarata]
MLPPGYITCLTICFNVWIKEGRYPEQWKLAKIVTLNKLKAGVPRCDQTRPISLLATHSELFEKIILEKVRYWAEMNQLIPSEQSGFRPQCLLPTRVLSIYQEVDNNMAANIPTLAIYVDYQKAYDKVWHAALIVKLNRLGMPHGLLKFCVSWLNDRQAYVVLGEQSSNRFRIFSGLPQGSSLSPYLFIVFHSDLTTVFGAHSAHLFADDLNVLIRPLISKNFAPMIEYLEKEGTKVCNQIAEYSRKWKQPINVSKTVTQIFFSQVTIPQINITMDGQKIESVKSFKYLGFTWTSNEFSDDILLDRTILVAPEMIKKNSNNETVVSPNVEQEIKLNSVNEETQKKKKKKKKKNAEKKHFRKRK